MNPCGDHDHLIDTHSRVAPVSRPQTLGSWPVDRIAIIGCGGSGKSHLARALGGLAGITPVYLDGLFYGRDWTPLDQERFAALQRDLVTAPRWIIDGNYASTLPIRLQAAGTVVFFDLPAWACLWGIIQRRLRHGSGQHVAIGVYDRITGNFLRYIAGYRRQIAPRVRQLIATHAAYAGEQDGLGGGIPEVRP